MIYSNYIIYFPLIYMYYTMSMVFSNTRDTILYFTYFLKLLINRYFIYLIPYITDYMSELIKAT